MRIDWQEKQENCVFPLRRSPLGGLFPTPVGFAGSLRFLVGFTGHCGWGPLRSLSPAGFLSVSFSGFPCSHSVGFPAFIFPVVAFPAVVFSRGHLLRWSPFSGGRFLWRSPFPAVILRFWWIQLEPSVPLRKRALAPMARSVSMNSGFISPR